MTPLDFLKMNFDWELVDMETDEAISQFLTPN